MAWWIFQNLVITTALAAVVALACRFGRIGPVARHALWVLVLVKFVTPPLVVWPWAAPDPFGIAALDGPAADVGVASSGLPPSSPMVADSEAVVRTEVHPLVAAQRDVAAEHVAASVWPWLLVVWALGSLCVLGVEGVRLARLRRRVRPAPEDHPIARRVRTLAAQLGVRATPVDMAAGISSPVVWGWGRPRLLWPAALEIDTADACIDGIVVHELAHIKRGDHFVGWIELAAGVVWWWNPLFWSVRSARREQAELACDAWVISALPNGRRAYAESLLLLSGAVAPDPSPMTAVGIRPGSRRVLERRLVMIMKGRTSLRLPWVGLCCLALVAAATLPAWASAQQPPPPAPQPAAPAVVSVLAQDPPPPPPPRAVPPPKVPVVTRKSQNVPKMPPPPRPVTAAPMPRLYAFNYRSKASLPEEGQQLLDALDADLKAIQEEADQKMEARRASAIKALEALQEQYTKAGKLDEAVAIRDYLRAGGPGSKLPFARYVIKR
jgi:beta-lactamase regulating signal transducer with metallopeptidase domain